MNPNYIKESDELIKKTMERLQLIQEKYKNAHKPLNMDANPNQIFEEKNIIKEYKMELEILQKKFGVVFINEGGKE